MPTVNARDIVSRTASTVQSRPKWLRWTAANTLSGAALLPSGHRRLVYNDASNIRTKEDYYVNPIALGASDADWRVVIYRSDGPYVTSTGLGDLPTIGTPQVRLGVNAPSKAVVRFPASRTPAVKWSDGQSAVIARGMEMTVEFRDASTDTLTTVFRGMIHQVESGDTLTVTAYDRTMDLVQYSDQYQSHAGYDQEAESTSRATSGTNYVYTMANNVGALVTAQAIDRLKIDPTSQTGHPSNTHNASKFYAIPLPKINSGGIDYTPEQGRKITKVKFGLYGYLGGYRMSLDGPNTLNYKFHARVSLYEKVGSSFVTRGVMIGGIYRTISLSITSNTAGFVEDSDSQLYEGNVYNWVINGDPSNYYLGVETYEERPSDTTGWQFFNDMNGYVDYTSTKLTFTGDFYTSSDGVNWSVGSGDHPEVGIVFDRADASVATNLFTISGNKITIARGNVPTGPADTYLSTIDAGIGMIISYFISGAAGIQGIVADLLEWAGLTPDVIADDMGQTTYYTSSTYDYMTCLVELLRAGNYAMMANISEPGKITVRKRHDTSETPVLTVSTDPSDHGTFADIVTSYDLTAHWAAEKATQAYIAENATSSGLPIALETDDALMGDSLVKAMQSPLRSIIVDNTLGTHDLLANAAGGKMVALHTNVIEGKMTLAGYRLDIWDLSSAYCGGQPMGIRVPEYGGNNTVIPTEIVIGDGVTQVSLDNIRTADRNEVANSMGLSADAISNNASAIPASVYIFARLSTYGIDTNGLALGTINDVDILLSDNTPIGQTDPTYIKTVKDAAGYSHIVAIFPSSAQPMGYATTLPIDRVAFTMDGTPYYIPLDNPKYAYGGQSVHVDIRFKSA